MNDKAICDRCGDALTNEDRDNRDGHDTLGVMVRCDTCKKPLRLCDACSARLDRDGLIKDEDLCARCAKLNIPAMTPELTDSSAKLLSFMAAIPNGHIVIMHNASTRTMTFLGKKEIADNPSLYDDAIAAGSVPIAFFAIVRCAPATSGMVEFEATVSKCPWCPFTDAELQESWQASMSAIGARPSATN